MRAEIRYTVVAKLLITVAAVLGLALIGLTARRALGAESPQVVWRASSLDRPRGVDVDRRGMVYVADTENHVIKKFDRRGNLLAVWGGEGEEPGEFSYPRDVAVAPDDRVYVADTLNDRVQVFTADGVFEMEIGEGRGSSLGWLDGPKAVAVDAWGNVYVADTFNNRIQVFDADGAVQFEWGGSGSADGLFRNPSGIAVSESGLVYVSDTFHDRVQVFNAAGGYLRQWGETGSGPGELLSPRGIDVDQVGRVYVSDSDNHRVQVFAPDGRHFQMWGSRGTAQDEFRGPKGLAVGPTGRIYVADQLNRAVKVFAALPLPVAAFDPDVGLRYSIGPASVTASNFVPATSHNLLTLRLLSDGKPHVADFLGFFRNTGGSRRWGDPLSEVFEEQLGTLTQYFQRGAIDWRYNPDTQGFEFQRRLSWEIIGGGAGYAADMGFEPEIVNPNAGVVSGPWGHKVSNFAVDGSFTGFLDFYSVHGGEESFGYPKTDARSDTGAAGTLVWHRGTSGRVRQYFQAGILEYSPDSQSSVIVPMIGYDLLWTLYDGDRWTRLPEFEPADEIQVGAAFGSP